MMPSQTEENLQQRLKLSTVKKTLEYQSSGGPQVTDVTKHMSCQFSHKNYSLHKHLTVHESTVKSDETFRLYILDEEFCKPDS